MGVVFLFLNKFKFPSLKDALCWVYIKIGSVVLEYIFKMLVLHSLNIKSDFSQIAFSLYGHYLPLEKGVSFHLNKPESHLNLIH